MRADLLLIAVAVLAVGFDRVVTSPSASEITSGVQPRPGAHALEGDRSAQAVGPLPSPALNPRLGSDPPGGSLRDRRVDPADVPGGRDGAVPPNPARIEPMDEERLGTPPSKAVPDAPLGAVPPPATGAVQPLPGPNVPPRPAVP